MAISLSSEIRRQNAGWEVRERLLMTWPSLYGEEGWLASNQVQIHCSLSCCSPLSAYSPSSQAQGVPSAIPFGSSHFLGLAKMFIWLFHNILWENPSKHFAYWLRIYPPSTLTPPEGLPSLNFLKGLENMRALCFLSQRYMCIACVHWMGWSWGIFQQDWYVRAFQTFETRYWPLFPEGWVKRHETGKASPQHLTLLYEE